jgi:hypothetical protein
MATIINESVVSSTINVYLYPDLPSKSKGTYQSGTPLRKLCAATVKYSFTPLSGACYAPLLKERSDAA